MYGFGFQPAPQIIGSLARANGFNEVQTAPVNANGAPTLFLMENEPTMYLVSLQNGQKSIQGYKMTPMPTAEEATENRISNLETAIMDIKSILEGKMKNEPNTASTQQIETDSGQRKGSGFANGRQYELTTESGPVPNTPANWQNRTK